MSNSKMLIDAAHPEETRVVVLKGNRIEEFDFESASKKQLRGNIYLAKVTRVEPSLQAAFVEYGGNRHGFLAFSEIHPDYYQIPFADRQALLEEEARAHRDEDDEGRGNGASESRSQGGGENRREGRRQEGRGNGEGRNQERGQGERSEGGERQARGEGRGERGSRNGERGQRRSRRHRRDHAPASALERRGAGDDSISESLVDSEAVELSEADSAVTMAVVDHVAADQDGNETEAHAAAPDHSGDAAVAAGTSQEEATAASAVPVDAPAAEAAVEVPAPGTADEPAAATAEAADAPLAAESGEAQAFEPEHGAASAVAPEATGEDAVEAPLAMAAEAAVAEEATDEAASTRDTVGGTVEARDTRDLQDDEHHEEEHVEQIGGDALSDVAPRPVRLRRHYKIQEVIKRRQILLIQVVKEERGNKGAALTTYLSLAGRYSVLMPNTAKGGGISRKITDGEDRKRLKAIAQELDVPEGMGVILRTAGAARSPIEVRRDFEYLLRMWESVRELTLKSSAPSLVYEEGSLIKRSIRDLYSKEVEEIVVSGEAGFAEARDFMRMLMPGNVKSVQSYRDPQPIFAKSGVEAQLDAMFSPHVTLKSGGYLVINQTEALVAIDVNSGRSTREHNIEDTALRTNLEAADEVARQLRLRDLAGLIVVDFIDMEEGRNNRAVERRIKEALKNDRARIQIGRISHFGLLEMSRQRIRTGVLEGSTVVCPHCAGAGTVRSTASIALHVLRLVEDALLKDASHDLVVRSRAEVALYMLNQKRAKLVELEQRFGVGITVAADPSLTGMVYHAVERGEPAMPPIAPAPRQDLVRVDSIAPIFEPGSEDGDEEVAAVEAVGEAEGDVEGESGSTEGGAAETGEGESDGRRRKRRRRRRGRDRDGQAEAATGATDAADEDTEASEENRTEAAIEGEAMPVSAPEGEASTGEAEEPAPVEASVASDAPESEPASTDADDAMATAPAAPVAVAAVEATPAEEPSAEEAPKRRRSRRTVVRVDESAGEATPPAAAPEEEAPARPRRRRTTRARAAVETVAAASPAEPPASEPTTAPRVAEVAAEPLDAGTAGDETAGDDPDRPKRSGWWQRAKASFGS